MRAQGEGVARMLDNLPLKSGNVVSIHYDQMRKAPQCRSIEGLFLIWWLRPDSNRGPHHYE